MFFLAFAAQEAMDELRSIKAAHARAARQSIKAHEDDYFEEVRLQRA